MRWRGGAITELVVPLPRHEPTIRTPEDTIALVQRLTVHYDDATTAGILKRQGRRSATGERFTAVIVGVKSAKTQICRAASASRALKGSCHGLVVRLPHSGGVQSITSCEGAPYMAPRCN